MLAKISKWIGATLFLVGLGAANAAPIAYTESASGDLNGNSVGTLALGSNTIQGTFCTGAGCNGDSFHFTLPSGLALEDISFTFATTLGPGATTAGTRFRLLDCDCNILSDTGALNILGSGTLSLLGSALPLDEAGAYELRQESRTGGAYTTAYTWTLQVGPAGVPIAQVGEPASLALFALALAVLGFSWNRGARRASTN